MRLRQAVVFGVLAVAVAAAGYGYFHAEKPKPGLAARPAAAPVAVAKVEAETVPVAVATIGNAQAYSTVSVKSRVDGQIFQVGFKEGQLVRKGDLLFVIDPRPFEAQLRQAQANLERDKAQLVRAQLDLKRYAELSKKDFAPQQQFENARATAESMQATVAADEAALLQAQLNLEYTRIKSPVDGLTGNLLINEGNIVKANDTISLVIINQVRPIYVSFAIPEQDLPEVKARMASGALPVEVTIPGDSGGPVRGEVTFINNAVDTSTGTIQLKATIANDDNRLTPGQFVNVRMTLSTLAAALVIPSQAVQTGQNGDYVYVVRPDQTVEQRTVELGPIVDAKAVVRKGLSLGDEVVIDGQLRLFPGARIEIRSAAQSKASPA
ncbi:MAG TPA: efflux RND transporter periplasmic adaptor subunit [Alphaproteobacteria bacterium]|nr:efflux RND transporter periplasmic adaptor subunit [Alphaproteobacteria bacterium]